MPAIDKKYEGTADFELIDALGQVSGVKEPKAVSEIRTAPVRHTTVCDVCDMEKTVKQWLNI